MLNTKILFSLLFVSVSSLSFAESISDEDMKKALEGITQTRVMEASKPKIISEVILTKKVAKVVKKATKQKVISKKIIKKITKKKITKKKITKKKVIKKKLYKKKIHKNKQVEVDISELKEVQTLGVVSKSELFELKN